MAALVPHPDDLVIRLESGGSFTLSIHSGRPQILCGSVEEALRRAGSFAQRRHVRTWYSDDGRNWTLLGDVGLLRRIWSQYADLPGLRLTQQQAQRLCAVDADTCSSLLKNLVDLKVLVQDADGRYARRGKGADALLSCARVLKVVMNPPPAAPLHRQVR